MTYLISDIHGDFRSFLKMLKYIEFDENDKMYILGDILDRGKENLNLLYFVKETPNIILIKGNHEFFAEDYLRGDLLGEQWEAWGGTNTRDEVDALNKERQEEILEYLESLPYYKQLKVSGKVWTLTHSGLSVEHVVKGTRGLINIRASIKKAAEQDPFRYLVSQDIHFLPSTVAFDTFLVVGHVPTPSLTGEAKILYENGYMDIDAGNGNRKAGGRLACYCIETKEEFYV